MTTVRSTAFVLFFAVIGVVVSIYSDIFGQMLKGDVRNLLFGPPDPDSRIFTIPDILCDGNCTKMSMHSEPSLYIFALDISGSLETNVDDDDFKYYIDRIADKASIPKLCQDPQNTWLDLARMELCRYLKALDPGRTDRAEEGPYVGIWFFGKEPDNILGEGNTIFQFEQKGGNVVPRREEAIAMLVEKIGELRNATDDQRSMPSDFRRESNFEKLVMDLHKSYINIDKDIVRSDASSRITMHIVVISDFRHDIGAGMEAGDIRYDASVERILANLENMADHRRVLFHLAAVGDGRSLIGSIVPVLEEKGPGWRNLKVAPVIDSDIVSNFDFLYPYIEVPQPLDLYYMDRHGKVDPIYIPIKSDSYVGAKFKLSLMSDLRGNFDQDPSIQIIRSETKRCRELLETTSSGQPLPQSYDKFILKKGVSREIEIKHVVDAFCIQPLSGIDRRTPYYKLLIAFDKGEGSRRTYAVTLRFKRYLPIGARWVLVAVGLIALWAILDFFLGKIADKRIVNLWSRRLYR